MYSYKSLSQSMHVIMTHSDLFGVKKDANQVIEFIQRLNLRSSLVLTSLLSAADKTFVAELKSIYINAFRPIIHPSKQSDILNQRLVSPQGLLYLYKWLLAYGDINLPISNPDPIDLAKIIHTQLMVADYLPSEEIVPSQFLFQTLLFSTNSNIGSDLARAFLIFTMLAKEKSQYEEKEYVDWNSDFEETYGYTIQQFLAVSFSLLGITCLFAKLNG